MGKSADGMHIHPLRINCSPKYPLTKGGAEFPSDLVATSLALGDRQDSIALEISFELWVFFVVWYLHVTPRGFWVIKCSGSAVQGVHGSVYGSVFGSG